VKIIAPNFKILFLLPNLEILTNLERYGRTCYNSKKKSPNSTINFIRRILKNGHHSVIEHVNLTVRFICDRGVTHELVRHRLAAYSQESTRYIKYKQGITVIRPLFWMPNSSQYKMWQHTMQQTEVIYLKLLYSGTPPQQARCVLPHSLKTKIVMTANLREWRHVINLRSSKTAHPQIREIMLPLLAELNHRLPIIFEDLYFSFLPDIKTLQHQIKTWNQINNTLHYNKP